MARGGRRAGKAGTAYANRTDLNGPAKIPGQTYGAQAQQVRDQQAIPVAAPELPHPDQVPSLLEKPSARPNEPITAGLPSGPGPGPEALATPAMSSPQPGIDELRALYQVFPYEGIRRLLDSASRT